MFIAKDKDGTYNAFILRPVRSTYKFFGVEHGIWTNGPFAPLWENIPYPYIQSLGIGTLSEMTWESDPIEVDIRLSK